MKKLKICAFICALATAGLTFTGCADTTWALKDGNITIPTGVYIYNLMNYAGQVQNSAAASSSSTSSKSNVWSQKIEGQNAISWAVNNAFSDCKTMAVIESLSKSRNVSLTSAQTSNAKSYADSYYSKYAVYKDNDISQTSLERIVGDVYLKQALFDSYYGEKGDKAVAANDVSDYYSKNYLRVKQIFISLKDSSTSAPLTGDKLTEAKNKANEALGKAKADPTHFDDLIKTYNQDTGESADGYVFNQNTTQYDQKFVDLAKSLKPGEVGMAEDDSYGGIFIEYKFSSDPKDASFSSNIKENVLTDMKGTEFENFLKDRMSKDKITINNKTKDKYNPQKLKLS